MDIDAHVDAIKTQGYTIIEKSLPDDEIVEVRAALAPYLQKKLMGRNDFEGYCSERVYALLAKSTSFAKIVEHVDVLSIVDRFLAPNYLLSANLAINVHPGETPQRFHADNAGVSADRTQTHGISTIWAFDDFTEDNGATEVIPGSHRWTDETPLDNDERAVKVIMPAGSVLILSGSLYHRGGANNSNSSRLAITPQFCQGWLRQLENMALAVPPQLAGRLSERIQELLGYNIREPSFMGYVDGLHPKRLIDPSYQGRKARGLPS